MRVIKIISCLLLIHWLTWCLNVVNYVARSAAQELAREEESNEPSFENRIPINFEERLNFYLDLKTRGFLKKMATREKLLLLIIRNITEEIQVRAGSGVLTGDIGFQLLYEQKENLVEQYSQELNHILALLDELEALEHSVQKTENLKLLDEIIQLKKNLEAALDTYQLYKKKPLTPQEMATLIQEYSVEMDSLLAIYERLDNFERRARLESDEDLLSQIQSQKRQLVGILGKWGLEGEVTTRLADEYISEATKIVEILKELDVMESRSYSDTSGIKETIERVKNSLLTRVDKRILELFEYSSTPQQKVRPTISEYFKEWRSARYSDFQVKYTQYKILKTRLIQTATAKERERMLEREASDALLAYAAADYSLAGLLFDEILNDYATFFPNLDGVIFYKSEVDYARSYFDSALEGYKKIIQDYPQSQFLGQALWKLMLICYTYDWKAQFFEYFDRIRNIPAEVGYQVLNKAYYLAGNVYLNEHNYNKARDALAAVTRESKYYMPARYLLGVVYANLDNYSKAKEIFEELVKKENYPWTDMNTVKIRNDALIKLGFLHYQRGEYEQAIKVFTEVSRGHQNYDASLMGQAWASLKKGQYEQVIDRVELLLDEYLSSNYRYEALVLAAHCKRILERPEESIRDLRHVIKARQVLEISKEYNQERRRILEQAKELDRLEKIVLERQDKQLYSEIVKIWDSINRALLAFSYKGYAGSHLAEEFNDERKEIARQIKEFEELITWAKEHGQNELVQKATQQRNRLVAVLETYQSNRNLTNANYFLDYPLAAKEGSVMYRQGLMKNVIQEMIAEKGRIERNLQETMALIDEKGSSGDMEVTLALELLEDDLSELQNQLNRVQIWLATHKLEPMNTNFDQWADFSGFGMSDITFSSLKEAEKKISVYSQNIITINNILARKKVDLESKIARFDKEIKKMISEMEAEKVRLEKLERQKYFQNIYFEKKQKEVEEKEEEQIDELDKIIGEAFEPRKQDQSNRSRVSEK